MNYCSRPASISEALSVSSMRVCQPSPVARRASKTSGDKRILTGNLVPAFVLPAGLPRSLALICSGVVMRPYMPAFACARDSRKPGNSCPASSSAARATFSISMFWMSIRLSLSDFLGRYVGLFRFGINGNQKQSTLITEVEVNYSRSTPLAFAVNRPSHFPCSVRIGYYISSQRIFRKPANEVHAFIFTPDISSLLLKFRGFNNCQHDLIVPPIKSYSIGGVSFFSGVAYV